MNPCGKVFTADELGFIADLVLQHDAYAICDEVYEHLMFDGERHIPLMTLPGMRDRTMRIGSAGKTFSLTGWKVGYVTRQRGAGGQRGEGAPEPDLHHARPTCSGRWRSGWPRTTRYFASLAGALQAKRDRLAAGLASLGLTVLPTKGSYFITTDFRPLGFNGDDVAFCRHITEHAKVTAIPVSAFYDGAGCARATMRASPSASAMRCWMRRWRGCGGISALCVDERRPEGPKRGPPDGGHSSVGRAPGCGPGCHGFESRCSPHSRLSRDMTGTAALILAGGRARAWAAATSRCWTLAGRSMIARIIAALDAVPIAISANGDRGAVRRIRPARAGGWRVCGRGTAGRCAGGTGLGGRRLALTLC